MKNSKQNPEKFPVSYSKELKDFLYACSRVFKDEQRSVKSFACPKTSWRKNKECPQEKPLRKRTRSDFEEKNAFIPKEIKKIALASCVETLELPEDHLEFFDQHRDVFYWEDKNKAEINCSERNCRFKTKQGTKCLVDHMISKHGYRDIPCDYVDCSYIAFSQKNLHFHKVNFHERKQSMDATHLCPYKSCQHSFRFKSEIRKHLNVHENIFLFCQYCQYRCINRGKLHDHLSLHFNLES